MQRAACLLLLAWAPGCGSGGTSTEDGGNRELRAEFEAIARSLRAGGDAFFGEQTRSELVEALETATGERERTVILVDLTHEHLKLGDEEAALATVEEALALNRSIGDELAVARLHRLRGLVHLRRAETANCVRAHNAQCCIYPLVGGGVHSDPGPAQSARSDYLTYLERVPGDLGARWLVNVAAMAVGEHPAGLPPEHVVPVPALRGGLERFVDVAVELGVDAVNLCGGVAVEDFDGDGLLDIMTSTSDPDGPLLLFRNAGGLAFEDVSAATGTSAQLGGLNCVAGDYDGDGDPDLLVLRGAWLHEHGRIRNSLLRNDGTAGFRDVTREAGLADPARPTQAACWGDFDLDGDLDLYVGNESRIETRGTDSHPSQLFRNEGDGSFTDVAVSAGVQNDGFCKGVAAGDYDNDGDLDLYASNVGPNRLYRNDGDLRFTEVAGELGVELPHRTFACWFFDYDNDGWLDLFVTSYDATIWDVAADRLGVPFSAHPAALFRNEGGTFRDVAREVGLHHPWAPMGANFGDVDGDGWLDIYLATGDPSYESLMPNVMLRNERGTGFDDVTADLGLGHLQKGHGVAFADLDGDGDQDIYHQLGGFYPGDVYANALFLNPGRGSARVTLVLEGVESHRSGYGARIRVVVRTEQGVREIHRAVGSVSSFGGSPGRQEIGLGGARAIELIEVTWPVSRTRQVFEEVEVGLTYRIREGDERLNRD